MANPDPGQVVSGKKFVPKNFSRCIDFKYIVFEKPDFGQKKPDPDVRETLGDKGDHHKLSFWANLNYKLKKIL